MNFKSTLSQLRNLWHSAKPRSGTDDWRGADLWNNDDLRGGAALVNPYEQSVWVHACIHTLAANVAQAPFRFSRGARKGEDLLTTGPLVELFNRPHPQLTRFGFWELYVSWLCLRGEVFVVPAQMSRQERRFYVLSPDQFQHVIDDHELVGWRYTGFGPQAPLESQVFLPDEVIHDRIANPFNTFGTNTSIYATLSTNVALSIVGTANHATNHLEIRNSSGAIIGYVATNGVYRSQYDFMAQFTTTDNTTNTVYAFTPANNSAVRVQAQAVAWNSIGSASYGRIGTFKNVGGTVSQVGGLAALGIAEDDTVYEALLDLASNQIRLRVAGDTGRTVNWTVYGTIFYAP